MMEDINYGIEKLPNFIGKQIVVHFDCEDFSICCCGKLQRRNGYDDEWYVNDAKYGIAFFPESSIAWFGFIMRGAYESIRLKQSTRVIPNQP